MRKTTITILTLSLGFLITLPATAQLGKVLADFQSYSGDLQTYLKNNLSPTLKPLEIQSQNAISDSTGELNIPNPVAAGDRILNGLILNSVSDKFENNSVVKLTSTTQEINRLVTRSSIASNLGKAGQIRAKIKLQNTEESLDNIARVVSEAEKANQTFLGEIQKQIGQLATTATTGNIPGMGGLLQGSSNQSDLQLQSIKIQSEQSKMLGESLAQSMHINHSLQYSNLNLANISQQMEETNRARRVDSSAEAARLLRTTSQMDLFGRQEK
ncbi:MAG: hypothetical protein KME32_02755 [Mojavia pulchra JT2-VF2]|jgi:hypothetical protein|uniref:Uncharacterized protein n=1 Tax=Mojavia pulchra JT2-VF2 TaxID=287848 RepID=A0A951UEJ0_9NOST|nr:hypothetical protein [Mojavia pulchra JT2-VF2]